MKVSLAFLLPAAAACSLLSGWTNQALAQVQYSWTNFAGLPGGYGSGDDVGSNARFNHLFSVAVDASGNAYVADSMNHTIRKVTPAGVVSTLAGLAGVNGSADGIGSAARFNNPRGVAVDSSGNVYVADFQSYTVRKITPAGVVSTLAGQANAWGYVDGTGPAARFMHTSGVAVDSSGNVYVSDYEGQVIRKITPAGVVTTFAGTVNQTGGTGHDDGIGTAARLSYPCQLAVDAADNLYVADTFGQCIRKVTPAGVVTTLAGASWTQGTADGTGPAARFNYPYGITVDASGNVYVADSFSHTIRKVTSAGVVTTFAGVAGASGFANGTGAATRFYTPSALATCPDGTMLVADKDNSALRRLTPAGVVTNFAGSGGGPGSTDGVGSAAKFNQPNGVATDASGNVFVADTINHTIRKITPAGVSSTFAGLPGTSGTANGIGAAARFSAPSGVAMDSSDNVYVADSANHIIRKITPAGVVSTVAGHPGLASGADGTGSQAYFNYPIALTVDGSGNVYVADYSNHTIRKITPAAVVTTLAGLAGSSFYQDGVGSAARFHYPSGIAVDAGGILYVADAMNQVIRKITPAGAGGSVNTFAGQPNLTGSLDGTGGSAQFNYPVGVATDPGSGDLYVGDGFNHTIRRVTPAGVVTTVGGLAGQSGGADGGGVMARFNRPSALAFDSSGNLYLADQFNNRITRGVAFQPAALAHFTDWQTSYFSVDDVGNPAVVSATADVDGDGLGNLAEYAFGIDPGTADAAAVTPKVGWSGGFAMLTFRRMPSRTDLNYLVEATDDLVTGAWTVIARSVAGGVTMASPKQSPSSISETAAGAAVTVTVGDAIPNGPAVPHRFLRLRVVKP